jgi:hypothetical protein
MSTAETMQVSLRECRLIVERVLLVAGVDAGQLPAAVDLVVAAEIVAGGEALEALEREITPDSIREAEPLAVLEVDGRPVLDARGASSLVAIPLALDLACAARSRADGVAAVLDVAHAAFVAGVVPLAARRGLDAEVSLVTRDAGPSDEFGRQLLAAHPHAGMCVVIRVRDSAPPREPDPVAELVGDPYAAQLVREGTEVESRLWWSLYERSELALSPASSISRLDTGVHAPPKLKGVTDAD